MRVPYKWLSEWVSIPWDAHELADRLTQAGVKVEAVEEFDAGLLGVVAATVEKVWQHPSSPRLWVCRVDAGPRAYQVVTGWPGMAAGQVAAFAPPGASLPKGWKIEEAEFGGVRSEGMLCALTEMLLGEPHLEGEGIYLLEDNVPPGTSMEDHLNIRDHVLELDLTPNYGYCLSMLGVAGEVAALAGAKVRVPSLPVIETTESAEAAVDIELADPDLCMRYVARITKGVTIVPSPAWLQVRLLAAGMRPISNIVDITNYVMLALGQPLHAFDYGKVRGKKIIVRRAGDTQVFTTLDGQERHLEPDMLVIADAAGPVGLAGVMGGLESEITSSTKDILLESALFNPISIRKTALALGLRSEASSRFERGIDPLVQPQAADLATAMMCQHAGGVALRGMVDANKSGYTQRVIALRTAQVRNVLGSTISDEETRACLEKLDFDVTETGPGMYGVAVPSRRVDVEIEEDLIEEVGRISGYDSIEPTLLKGPTVALLTPPQVARHQSIEIMVGLGFEQVVTMSFISPKDFERTRAGSPEQNKALVLRNPLAEEQSVMRQSLLPGLLGVYAYNAARKNLDLATFELSRVYLPGSPGGLTVSRERYHLAVLASRTTGRQKWNGATQEVDFLYAKGALEAFVGALTAHTVKLGFEPSSEPRFHPYRQARVEAWIGGRQVSLGHVAEVSLEVASAYGLEGRFAAFEIDCEELFANYPYAPHVLPVPRYPAVSRDVALVVPDGIPAEQVLKTLQDEAGNLLESIELFDVYRRGNIPEGSRSLAYSLVYRAQDHTLKDAEVDELHEKVRKAVITRLGAVVR